MARHIDLNPASHLTVGAVGAPGQRVFYIQGRQEAETISLIFEKEQSRMLADSLESLLTELERRGLMEPPAVEHPIMDMRLQEPLNPLFRIGNMGLGYDERGGRVVIAAYELVEDDDEPNAVSFWISREHAAGLIDHIREVVNAGRPICGNCGGPIDPNGHFCPHRNGHAA